VPYFAGAGQAGVRLAGLAAYLKIGGGAAVQEVTIPPDFEAMQIPLVFGLSAVALASGAALEQHPWHSVYSGGKPSEMLQVGRFPHLGCSPSPEDDGDGR
jgi:hypothetical protein